MSENKSCISCLHEWVCRPYAAFKRCWHDEINPTIAADYDFAPKTERAIETLIAESCDYFKPEDKQDA